MEGFPRRWGAYVLIRPLGAGGMGDVFLALQGRAGHERLCVVKRLIPDTLASPERLSRFRREAEIARALAHGAIAQTIEVGELAGEPYIVQEFIEGRNIAQLVSTARGVDEGHIPIEISIHIVRELARALAHAHAAGIVHRDIAPENLMVSFSGQVKLVDFGIARAAADPSLTTPGMIVGRLSYTAPEVLAGGRADPRADVYAAGVLLWELLTGQPAMFGTLDQPPSPSKFRPELPATLDAIVLRTLASDPLQRMPTAEELQRALGPFLGLAFVGDQILQQFIARCYNIDFLRRGLEEDLAAAKAFLPETSSATADFPPSATAPPRAARARLALAGAALLAIAGAGVVIHLRRKSPPVPQQVLAPPHSAIAARNPAPPPPSLPPTVVVPAIPVPPSPADAATAPAAPKRGRTTAGRRAMASGTAAGVLLDRALDSLQEGDTAGAEAAAREVLPMATAPQRARAHVILAKVLVLRGQYGVAAQHYSEALQLDPGNDAAASGLAHLRRRPAP